MASPGTHKKPKPKSKRQEASRREEGVQATRERMVAAQKNAQKIFLSLVEDPMDVETLKNLLCYINPDIYEQVETDRGSSGVCGYPMCTTEFDGFSGDQRYRIRNNKVYDITLRRNFCSDVCYEASKIVKEQVSVEPLYLRDDLPRKSLEVIIPDREKLKGLYGEEIDIGGGVNPFFISQAQKSSKSFTSFAEVAQDGLRMCAENSQKLDKENHKKSGARENNKSNSQGREPVIPEEVTSEENQKLSSWRQKDEIPKEELKKEDESHNEEIFNAHSAVLKIERALQEWMTFESLRMVLGDVYVKGMLEHFGEKWEDYNTSEGMELSVEAKAKYIALCRKLDEEERNDTSGLGTEGCEMVSQPRCPLPDYQQLQEDAKKQQLKVVSFLGGKDQYEDNAMDLVDKDDKGNSTLPLIDSFSQVEWRQSIVLEKFEKYMSPYLPVAKLDGSKVKSLVRDLVMTFNLSPNNIIFKPGQWNFVTLLVLKMLSIRIPAIKAGMEMKDFLNFQEKLLSNFHLDMGYPDRFLSFITEIKPIIRQRAVSDDKRKSEDLAEDFNKLNIKSEVKATENKEQI
ncbi:putative RNA polymerase II subunit B1 CTD phosphatase RPAP2 [Palaemon carinicauda]|uniref:putative RNA polymerase II subunit B1 CTD phosphatase RPAP2 n=1 Tax=Palaemon carinicauda TaxID=392227 RepID=UPI0035B579C1